MTKITTSLCFAATLLLVEAACAQDPTTNLSDGEAFGRFLLPVAEDFARLPGLPLENGLATSLIRRWKLGRLHDTGAVVSATIALTNHMSLRLLVRQTNSVVFSFTDMRIDPNSIAGDDNPNQARFFSSKPNYFTLESAREFASAFFRAAGHKPENFRLSLSWQLGWGDPKDTVNYIPLPFYQFEWLRKDVKEVKSGQISHPRVRILVSGLDRKVLVYQRLFLPVTGDFEQVAKQP